VPESNLSAESNSGSPQAAQRYCPDRLWFQQRPVNGGSVAEQRQTAYCSGESCSRHSSSLRWIGVLAIGCS
jgi:hypothetical protein